MRPKLRVGLACVGIIFITFFVGWLSERPVEQKLGVTFSTTYAEWLGLDSERVFTELLDELQVRRFRIPVYWNEVERLQGVFDWTDLDRIMAQSEARGAEITLAIGAKVPRWPECYIPDWAKIDGVAIDKNALKEFLRTAVERYKGSKALVRWQIENEAFFSFGSCPEVDAELIAEEVAFVRSIDSHPIQMTASGELEPWLLTGRLTDVLGTSLYRKTRNPWFGDVTYPIPAWFYHVRSWMIGFWVEDVVISELQAEPWRDADPLERTAQEWDDRFGADDLRTNVEYASRTGISEAYLWGVEWWYFMKQHGESGLWEEAKELFSNL